MITLGVLNSTCHLGYSCHIAMAILNAGILRPPYQVIEIKHIKKFMQPIKCLRNFSHIRMDKFYATCKINAIFI